MLNIYIYIYTDVICIFGMMILNDGFEGVETDCKLMITDVHSPVGAQVLLNPHCRIYQCCFSGTLVHWTCHFLRTFGNKNLWTGWRCCRGHSSLLSCAGNCRLNLSNRELPPHPLNICLGGRATTWSMSKVTPLCIERNTK